MFQEPTVTKRCPLSIQVWARLAGEQRTQAIRLMAQMAFNLIVTQTTAFNQESQHVSANQPEDSS